MASNEITRRTFLKGAAGLNLALFVAPGDGSTRLLKILADGTLDAPGALLADLTELGLYVKIGSDNTAVVYIPKPDMGQGPRTSLAMAVAEELEVDWTQVRIEQAGYDSRFDRLGQTSGGSQSTRRYHKPMLAAGATARVMLVRAAAQQWSVDESTCRAASGSVVHDASGRSLTYGDVAAAAAALPVPPANQVDVKTVGEYRILGQPQARLDNPDLVTGQGVFGSDVRVPGMLFAVIARPYAYGGRVGEYDDTVAKAVPGVRQVFRYGSGIAVVAENTWAAMAGRDALQIDWDPGRNADLDDAQIRSRLVAGIGNLPGYPGNAVKQLDAEYELPYLAHAPMEPMVSVANVEGDRCEVWVSTQSPSACLGSAASGAGVPRSNVTVNVMLAGGGFGRRLSGDYAGEAARLSREAKAPVQIVWSRDDDMRHDSGYRPASHHGMRGAIDGDGNVAMFHHEMAKAGGGGDDDILAFVGSEEAFEIDQAPPYSVPNRSGDSTTVRLPIPTGAWRSVDATQICFANESFMDELAHAAEADPYAFRRQYLSSSLRRVLDLAADKADWDSPVAEGVGRGIACYAGFGSYAAHVVELSVSNDGVVRVHRVVAAIDCGFLVNPSGAAAQVEGAISDGLSTALKAGINIQDGGVVQSSYADYEWLRIDEMPVVETHFVTTAPETPGDDVRLGGLGEPGFPSVSPAVANAIFDLTGRRLRRLPIVSEDLAGWMGAVTPTVTSPPPTDTPTTPPTTPPTGTPTSSTPPPPTGDGEIYLPTVVKGK